MNLRVCSKKPFFINLNFYVWFEAQKCLNTCVYFVIKLKLFFLYLSSKIPAGVIVRMSKYPYMDICAPSPPPSGVREKDTGAKIFGERMGVIQGKISVDT